MGYRKKLNQAEATKHIEDNHRVFKKLYVIDDMTARKVAENQNIEFSQSFARALFNVFGPKGKGKGGSRLGSGNKKGVKFCNKCRKKIGNCGHEQ